MVDVALVGVDVLGLLFICVHTAGGEAYGAAVSVTDWDDDTVAVEIVQVTILAYLKQPHLRHQLDG